MKKQLRKHQVDPNFYARVHYWLRKEFGKADKCEMKDCSGKSSNYAYALLKGKSYECKRINFKKMCKSCHSKYDVTDEGKKAISQKLMGHPVSKELREYLSQKFTGKEKPKSWKKVYAYKEGKLIKVYESVSKAAKDLNASVGNISSCCSPKYPQAITIRGFNFSYNKI